MAFARIRGNDPSLCLQCFILEVITVHFPNANTNYSSLELLSSLLRNSSSQGYCWMFSVSQCSKTEIFIILEGKSMIPNECINFNAEIQFKEHFIEVQFPKNVMSLLSQNIFFLVFPKWDSQSPSLWLSFINFFSQRKTAQQKQHEKHITKHTCMQGLGKEIRDVRDRDMLEQK